MPDKKNKSFVFLDQLAALPVDEIIMHSMADDTYTASVVLGSHVLVVYEFPEKPLSRRNMSEMKRLLSPAACNKIYLLKGDVAVSADVDMSSNAMRIRLNTFEENVA
jgi:hypothetical protein